MKKMIFGLVIVLCTLSFLFVACQRPASVSPAAPAYTATSDEIPFPAATQPQIMADILKSTQTALALATHDTSFPSAATSTPAFVFNTPGANTTPATTGTTQATLPVLMSSTPTANSTLEVGGNVTSTSTPTITLTPTPAFTPTSTQIWYPTSTPGRPATYTLQDGEFPWCLARRFDVNVSDLLALNHMTVYSRPVTGTVINIPTSGAFDGTRALKAHPATYAVLPGDTMGSIACGFGDADPNVIYAANGLPAGSVIIVGQVLKIP